MSNLRLFRTSNGWVTVDDLRVSLEKVGARDCSILYMHSGLSFGTPNPEMSRSDLLQELYEVLRGLGVETFCVPTFTFSFCNKQNYDVNNSRSHMGALNEFIRKQEGVIRSSDPLMSVALIGKEVDLVKAIGTESIGRNSSFDLLSRKKDVKFLFFGVQLGDCCTYMHYLEWLAKVPYRYDRVFSGMVIDQGVATEKSYTLFVRYNNVIPNDGSYELGRLLQQQGSLKLESVGDSSIGCVAEPHIRALYLDLLDRDPNFFITQPFNPQDADPVFVAHNMVAL